MWLKRMPEKQHYFKSYPSLPQVDEVRLHKPQALLKSTRKPRKPALRVPQRNGEKSVIYFPSLSLPLKHNKEPGKSVCDANSPGINMQHNFQML